MLTGPNELKSSVLIGVVVENGGAPNQGTAPTPIASAATGWP